MEGGFGGVGRFRDLGDYRDERRRLGAIPLRAGDPRTGTSFTEIEKLLLGMQDSARIEDPAMATGYDSEYLENRAARAGQAGTRPNITAEELQLMQGIARDPEAEYAASLYPARVDLSSRTEAEILQDYLNRKLPQERGVRAEKYDDIVAGDFDASEAPGGFIRRQFQDDINPYGSVTVPFRTPRDRIIEREVYPSTPALTVEGDLDSTAAFDRYNEMSLGELINQAAEGSKTPLIGRDELKKALDKGDFVPARDRNQIGFLKRGGQEIPVYQIQQQGGEIQKDYFRLGSPTARNYDKLRTDIADRRINESNPLSTRMTGRVKNRKGSPVRGTRGAPASLRETEIEKLVEIGAVPFLNRDDQYAKVGGIRKNVEKKFRDSDGLPVSFNKLLDQLSQGAFMDEPDVANGFRALAALEDEIGRPIFEPGTVGHEAIRRVRVEASGREQGREVDLFAEDPNLPDYPDSPAEEIVYERDLVENDIRSLSNRKDYNRGYAIESPNQGPSDYKTATAESMSGPVTKSNMYAVEGYVPQFSAAEAQAVREQYRNPKLTGFLRATSQPEIDLANGELVGAFDKQLSLLRGQVQEQTAPDTGTALNAPANTGSVEDQQRVIDAMPQGVRQNVVRGLAEGASEPSRNAALEFLARFRNKMFSR